ncbi:MAG: S-methyl-5-thioribose-1-phosphate isomerase, partial [Candidatus Eisenbacteria bacterium]|nr:S-methyl-5-thioribose-1-phosphate isomerase [Candidatus Eisenbacteria bacterium]
FYVVAPWTTIDPSIPDGEAIQVEERSPSEIARASGWGNPPPPAWNPAFDVTPASRITAWVTDRGVVRPPFSAEFFPDSDPAAGDPAHGREAERFS